jgi:hypothetical protein
MADQNAIVKTSYSHDKMIDLIVANPRVRQRDLAAHFGYTEGWVSRVMGSDAFRLRMALRQVELVDPIIVAKIEERFNALAMRGMEVLQEKLDQPSELIGFGDACKAVELGSRGLGVGGFGAAKVEINNNVDLRGAIEEAQARRAVTRLTPAFTVDTEWEEVACA